MNDREQSLAQLPLLWFGFVPLDAIVDHNQRQKHQKSHGEVETFRFPTEFVGGRFVAPTPFDEFAFAVDARRIYTTHD